MRLNFIAWRVRLENTPQFMTSRHAHHVIQAKCNTKLENLFVTIVQKDYTRRPHKIIVLLVQHIIHRLL